MKAIVISFITLALLNLAAAKTRGCGVKSGKHNYPWVVRVESKINGYDSMCYAVLINEEYALGPHSCFGSYDDVKYGNTRAQAIVMNRDNQRQTIEITKIEKFTAKRYGQMVNLALLKLASRVDATPACLPTDKPSGNLVILADTGDYGKYSETRVQLYNMERCRREYLQSRFQYELEKDKFCAVGDKQASCDGTALGLMFQRKAGVYYTAGIFSFDFCESELKNGYTRVNDYVDQIEKMISGRPEHNEPEVVTLMPLLTTDDDDQDEEEE